VSILSDFAAALNERHPLQEADVLDVGCGDGAFVRELTRAGAQVTGLECSEAQLVLCREAPRAGGERYVEGVGQSLPFPDESFDVVVFRGSLHHVPAAAMAEALREARRVLRTAGDIHVFEPLTTGTHFRLTRIVEDETEVRAQAQAAMTAAVAEGWLQRAQSAVLEAEVVYEDLGALRRRIVAIDASRAGAFDARLAELERAFATEGKPVEGGRLFTQLFRLDVLR